MLRPADLGLLASLHAAMNRVADLSRLVSQYRAHAQFEEQEYLPLAQQILGRNGNHMAALGLSLHMRHQNPTAFQFYV